MISKRRTNKSTGTNRSTAMLLGWPEILNIKSYFIIHKRKKLDGSSIVCPLASDVWFWQFLIWCQMATEKKYEFDISKWYLHWQTQWQIGRKHVRRWKKMFPQISPWVMESKHMVLSTNFSTTNLDRFLFFGMCCEHRHNSLYSRNLWKKSN